MDKKLRSVILARVSSKAQEDEGYSLDSQDKLLQNYFKNKGLDVVKVFKIAETASKQQSRKVFHELLNYLEKNDIYHLGVEKTDRLTRNLRDAVAVDDWLEADADRRLHAVKENLIVHKEAKSDVKFIWNIHVAVAKKFVDNLREEAMKGWAEKLAQGWLPGVPPPGYMTITESGKRIHVPNPDSAPLMQRIFKLYLDPNHTIITITKEMAQIGIRTRKGRPYVKSAVQTILNNPFYIGINHFQGKDWPGVQTPIIDNQTYKKVQLKMHGGRPAVFKKHNPILKNVITCEGCGKVVTWQYQKGRYYGACQRNTPTCKVMKFVREDYVEGVVIKMLQNLVCPSEAIIEWVASSMRDQYKNSVEQYEKTVAALQAQINRISRMDEDLYDDKLAGEITKERYQAKHEQLVAQKAELESELKNSEKTSGVRLEQKLVLLELSQKAAQLYSRKSPEQKRLIITKLFNSITSNNGVVSVKYSSFAHAVAEKVRETCKVMEV